MIGVGAIRRWTFLAVAAWLISGVAALGQPPPPPGGPLNFGFGPQDDQVVRFKAEFTPPAEGKPARLFITAVIEKGYHIYSITQAPGGPEATEIKLPPSPDYRVTGPFQASEAPHKKIEKVFKNLTVESHEGTLTWHAPIEIAQGVDPAKLEIKGLVHVQPCDAHSCLLPTDTKFTARLGRGVKVPEEQLKAPAPGPAPPQPVTSTSNAPPPPSVKPSDGLPWQPYTNLESFRQLVDPSFDPEKMSQYVLSQLNNSSLGLELLYAFLGGLILNIMPCVLPVIGLKVLSFVEQAGHSRARALMLNVWYSAGLLAVFLLLAALAVGANLGWGHLFKYAGFNVALICVVFAMGLSFLGVWEIPIPGFVGGSAASKLSRQEGFAGAFLKGVITTVLATPCTGPFMGSALAWAVNQPPARTFAVFGSVGLGMASPYLLIGVFPGLLRFLPKPGAWMETFKQVMGFVLLGTVVYMFSFLELSYVVPALGMAVAVWAACWWINRFALAEAGQRLRAWLEGGMTIAVVWVFMFPGLGAFLPNEYAFRGMRAVMQERVDRLVDTAAAQRAEATKQLVAVPAGGGPKTVLIDFTADWCLTCKTLEAAVLNTAPVRQAVAKNGVVTLQGDWTHSAPEVTSFLTLLRSKQVPVIVIFPAARPNQPIVFRGAYTQDQLLEALEQAGPSKG